MEHSPSTHAWLVALEQSGLGGAMRQSLLLYPAIEVLHILGFALLVGSIVGFDLRLLGLGRWLPFAGLARHNLPLAVIGLCVAAPTGLLLFATEATRIAINPAFQFKLICIGIGLANAGLFHLGPGRSMSRWTGAATAPMAARVGAAVSICAWVGALIGGRLIAYL